MRSCLIHSTTGCPFPTCSPYSAPRVSHRKHLQTLRNVPTFPEIKTLCKKFEPKLSYHKFQRSRQTNRFSKCQEKQPFQENFCQRIFIFLKLQNTPPCMKVFSVCKFQVVCYLLQPTFLLLLFSIFCSFLQCRYLYVLLVCSSSFITYIIINVTRFCFLHCYVQDHHYEDPS